MTTRAQGFEIAEDVLAKIHELRLHAQTPQVAGIVWRRILDKQDRNQLGGDLEEAYARRRTVEMWRELFGASQARAVIDISLSVGLIERATYKWLLVEIGEVFGPGDGLLLAAIETGALVLLQSPPTAYWNREEIKLNWQKMRAPWKFFWEISVKAKRGLILDYCDLGEGVSRSAAENRKCHLLKPDTFPADLGKRFTAAGNGAYKLDLPRERIRILEVYHETTFVEFSGWKPACPIWDR